MSVSHRDYTDERYVGLYRGHMRVYDDINI